MSKKDHSWSGLDKVPDVVIIAELRKEIGQLQAYTQELEYRLCERMVAKVKWSKLQAL
jgi:hypothetical protein